MQDLHKWADDMEKKVVHFTYPFPIILSLFTCPFMLLNWFPRPALVAKLNISSIPSIRWNLLHDRAQVSRSFIRSSFHEFHCSQSNAAKARTADFPCLLALLNLSKLLFCIWKKSYVIHPFRRDLLGFLIFRTTITNVVSYEDSFSTLSAILDMQLSYHHI